MVVYAIMEQNNANKSSIDEIDQRIIEALQLDGRRPFTKLAAELGISEASVRQRVNNLINTQVMQIVAITNPLKMGFSLASMIGIRVSGERLLEVVSSTRRGTARDLVDAIFAAVHEFRGDTPPNDDMTAVALKITS